MTTRISAATVERVRAIWPALLADIAGGDGIAEAIKAHGLSRAEARAFRALDSAADADWQRAKEESADALADEALNHARNPVAVIAPGAEGNEKGTEPLVVRVDAAFARVRIETLLKIAAKRNPRTYSDKAQLDVNVRTVDLTRIIEAANQRLLAGRAPRILEHDQGVTALIEHAPGSKELADLL
jgi:hypothetical protein